MGGGWPQSSGELQGLIRRKYLDRFVNFSEARTLRAYAHCDNNVRTRQSVDKDAPRYRFILPVGRVAAHIILGGLHYQYARI